MCVCMCALAESPSSMYECSMPGLTRQSEHTNKHKSEEENREAPSTLPSLPRESTGCGSWNQLISLLFPHLCLPLLLRLLQQEACTLYSPRLSSQAPRVLFHVKNQLTRMLLSPSSCCPPLVCFHNIPDIFYCLLYPMVTKSNRTKQLCKGGGGGGGIQEQPRWLISLLGSTAD